MTIDDAIENILAVLELDCHIKYQEWRDGLKLGIEALKRRKYQSEQTSKWVDMPLPGETEEEKKGGE